LATSMAVSASAATTVTMASAKHFRPLPRFAPERHKDVLSGKSCGPAKDYPLSASVRQAFTQAGQSMFG
jgi:hypothetical protein